MGTRQTRGRRRYNPDHVQKVLQTVLMVLLVVALCIIVGRNVALNRADTQHVEPTPPPADSGTVVNTDAPASDSPAPDTTPEPTPSPTPEPFEPHSVDSTAEANFLQSTDIMVDGEMFEGEYEDDTGI